MANCNSGAFVARDIIKYGYMMIKRPPTSGKVRIKAWQSKFFVLRDTSLNIPQRLEYYKDESAFDLQKSPEHCFYLDSVVFIGETRSSKSHSHAIMVVCSKQGALTLACDAEEATKDWIQALNKVAVKVNSNGSLDIWMQTSVEESPATTPELTKCSDFSTAHNSDKQVPREKLTRARTVCGAPSKPGYLVTTRLTPHSERNNIRGDYMLCLTEGELLLQSVDRSLTVVTWPVSHLRSFKSESAASAGNKDMKLLTLSAGSRSSTGEGIFQFFTKQGDAIADEIRVRSQQMATRKREAFRTRSSSGSDVLNPSAGYPTKKLQRGLTAPPQKPSAVLTRKEKVVVLEGLKKSRADTMPSSEQQPEKDSSLPGFANGSVVVSSSSTDESRPRSATDSSVERSRDDEVFLTQATYCEINKDEGGSTPEESDADAYIDLLSDETAEPIHISDPVPSRKISSGSQASSCSFTSDEGNTHTSSLPRVFSGAELIPEECEMDSEGYIRCEALERGPGENTFDRNGNRDDSTVLENLGEGIEMSCSVRCNLPSCPVDPDANTPNRESLRLASSDSRISKKTRENLLAQIIDPSGGSFPPKPRLERERPLGAESVFPPVSRTHEEEARSPDDPVDSLLDKARDPKSSKELLDQILAQMEKPQQNDVSQLFPAATRKRNSIGAVNVETTGEFQQNVPGKEVNGVSFSFKKHSMIEKRASACDGFVSQVLGPGPPPVPPNRPDSAELSRRRGYSSVGDLSDELPKRPDSMIAHRSTFFAKGMGSVNPQTLMTPLRTSITGHLGGEAAIHARLIEKTEMRDELAHSSAARNRSAGDDTSSCLIANGRATCAIADETMLNSMDSSECRVDGVDEDGQVEVAKRKDSKASKFVKKVFKLAPKARRGSNETRESYEQSSPPSERPRRESLSPGDAVELQNRFSGSEPTTPESSPKMGRKNSKTSPKDLRKISIEEKGKKGKESSASKILQKVTQGDLKKEELTKKDFSEVDSATKSPSLNKNKAASPDKPRKESKGDKSKESRASEMTDTFHQEDAQSGCSSGIPESQRTSTSDGVGDTAPTLPPRKRFEAPPLPPRLPKTSSSNRSVSPPNPHGVRAPQLRHSNTGRRLSGCGLKDEYLPPPPVPPRNSQSPEPKRSAARAPVIQLTCSSPENKDDASEKQNSDSEEDPTNMATGKSPDRHPPIMSAAPRSPESLSHPVPRRPAKEERRTQAKDYFRSHANQHVCAYSSDSEGGEMDDDDFPARCRRYGNIDAVMMELQASEEADALAEEHASRGEATTQARESTESKRIESTLNQGAEEVRVIESQDEAVRLKITMMKESSFDEDIAFESNSAENEDEKKKIQRPRTPLNVRGNVRTLSSVSIN